MDIGEKQLSKILSLTILFLLVIGASAPVLSAYSESNLESNSDADETLNDVELTSDDTWVIDDTVNITSDTELDHHILIEDDGELIINDSTLTLLIDEYHPWEIMVRDGGRLELNGGTITTQLMDDDVLRPFIKTNISAHDGSEILLREGSSFKFPGWVYLENSNMTMRDSSFESLEKVPVYVDQEDNNNCPRLTALEDSYVLIEDSEINDYYRFEENRDDNRMQWHPYDVDDDDYNVEPGDSFEVDQWYLEDEDFPFGVHRYVNPYNRISALYLEITYSTEENYTVSSPLQYLVNEDERTALDIEPTDEVEVSDRSDIWDLDIDSFYRGDEEYLKDLTVSLENLDDGEQTNITIEDINLVSEYNNDIYIRDSEMVVINSHIDVDYEKAQPDPLDGDSSTSNDTWMQDANLERSAIRLINSDFRSYGIYPQDEWEDDGDPFLIADEDSNHRTWYYRWVSITAVDDAGTPLPNTEITVDLDEHYENAFPDLYEMVNQSNALENNVEAWDYLNEIMGEDNYDPDNEVFVTDRDGQALMFLISDRVNHPQDWPNTRSVGDYDIHGEYDDDGDLWQSELDINLRSFPRMNETSTFHDYELVFDDEISLPDFNVTDDDLRILKDEEEVNEATVGETLELNLTVTNDGTKDALEDIIVRFSVEDTDIEIDEVIEDGLDTDETKTVSVDLDTEEMEAGDHTVVAHVDPENEHEELNTDNNMASREFTLNEKADLSIEDIIGHPDETITFGEDLSVESIISNDGGTDAEGVNVTISYSNETLSGTIHDMEMDVPAGEEESTGEILWDYEDDLEPGVYEVEVLVEFVDDLHDISESDSRNFTILSPPDIEIEYLTAEPTEVYDGDEVDIEAQIINTGETTSSSLDIFLYVDEGTEDQELIYSDSIIDGLEEDQTYPVSATWIAEMLTDDLSEDRTITLLIEPEDESSIRESIDIEIQKPAHLVVPEEEIYFSTELSQVDEPLEINSTVRNLGGTDEYTTVRFYDGIPEEDNLIDETSLMIEAGSAEEVEIEWTPDTRGNREIHVIAYYEEDDEYIDEDNHAMVVKPIFSEDYGNDLIVGGDDFEDEREIGSYTRSGFIVVQGEGRLTITGDNPRAVFNLVMDSDNRYGVMLRDQGVLEIEYGEIRSDHQFDIDLEDDSELHLTDDSFFSTNANLMASHRSHVRIDHTVFQGSMEVTDNTSFEGKESDFTSQDVILSPSHVDLTNCTFEADLVDFHDTTGSLTWVETGAIEATGDSEIELYRWLRATASSKTRLPLHGAEITAENLDTDYTVTETTDRDGVAHLKVLTDIITSREAFLYNNYRLSAEYVPEGTDEVFEVQPFTDTLPHYNTQEYIIDLDMHFEDLAIPDLSIDEDDIYTDVEEIRLGDEISIFADIENIGETEAFGVDVEFFAIFEDDEERSIGVVTLESVPTEDHVTADITWTTDMVDETQPSEEVDIRVEIDDDVEPLPDPNLDNNVAVRTFTINSLPILEFDSDIILWRDGTPLEDDEIVEFDDITINAELGNTGGTDLVNGTVTILISGSEFVSENIDVESGATLNYSQDWLVQESGEHEIEVWYNSSEEDLSLYMSRTINIQEMVLEFIDVVLRDPGAGEDKIVEGTLIRDDDTPDGTPIPGIEVNAYLVDGDGIDAIMGTSDETDDDGEFIMAIPEPADEGTYSLSLEADYPGAERVDFPDERVEVGEPVDTGIPLWMIIAVIGAIAAGSVGGIFAYIKIQGPAEWVECGNCGTTIPADVQECPECGVEFETETVKCSECGDWIPYTSDECPNCGSTFIKTGKEVQDYEETMKNQYERYVEKQRTKAKAELGQDFTDEEFMEWWQEQPSYITFDEWLEREEARRKEGGIECPECGALNSVDDAICQKCGSTLISLGEDEEDEEGLDIDLSGTDEMLGLDIDTDEGEDEDIFEEELEEPEEEPEEKQEVTKKPKKVVKKKPKKVVKKKVKKKPNKKDEE